MSEKKELTQEEKIELSEDELKKVSGGYKQGDVCPKCGKATLVNDKYYNYVICPNCDFYEGDSRSR